MPLSFHANGKLLLSGEYFVLDGAKAIGLPSTFGQSLHIEPQTSSGFIFWKSKNDQNVNWFEGVFHLKDFSIKETTDTQSATVLQNILQQARFLNPNFLSKEQSIQVETRLDFPRLWGLGTSSTLLYTLAKWAEIDPFQLSKKTLGGSGYDIACAGSDSPILYQNNTSGPLIEKINFDPIFKQQLFFIYLSKKQNSRSGIQRYREKSKNKAHSLDEVSQLTNAFLKAHSINDFQKIMLEHEDLVSKTIEMPKVQDVYFSDFEGVVKSLGAWGGDFVLAATVLDKTNAKEYFNKKGFETFLEYKDIIR